MTQGQKRVLAMTHFFQASGDYCITCLLMGGPSAHLSAYFTHGKTIVFSTFSSFLLTTPDW